ncbi:MAG TPA: hypothetical protein VH394_01390 [Thermoanaerobaculia bacterium]|jgi:hypothetical protein|nr:hypothetical protein [Thermoanaerobaculia bacterium]
MTSWDTLGRVGAERLADARLQLHWATQAASAVGKQLVDHRPDYGEQSFQWDPANRLLVQGQTAAGFRSALRSSPPALLLLGASKELPLDGRTVEEAYAWLESEIPPLLGRPLERPLDQPGEMPSHAVGSGSPISAHDREAFEELAAWLDAAHQLLSGVAARHSGASAVRLWPHHFDIATLISLDPEGEPETARSIGAGLALGDSFKGEPYIYITPWPYPSKDRTLPPPDGGTWNTEGWTGAYLEASRLLDGPAGERAARARRFVDSAVAACLRLLER